MSNNVENEVNEKQSLCNVIGNFMIKLKNVEAGDENCEILLISVRIILISVRVQ